MNSRFTTGVLAAALCLPAVGAFAQRHDHDRFDDNDRNAAHEWYKNHHKRLPVGFRENDRLEARHEERLKEGFVLDNDFRRRIHPVPSDLRLAAPPRGQRYVIIGGRVVLIDKGYRVHDVLRFDFNL